MVQIPVTNEIRVLYLFLLALLVMVRLSGKSKGI